MPTLKRLAIKSVVVLAISLSTLIAGPPELAAEGICNSFCTPPDCSYMPGCNAVSNCNGCDWGAVCAWRSPCDAYGLKTIECICEQ